MLIFIWQQSEKSSESPSLYHRSSHQRGSNLSVNESVSFNRKKKWYRLCDILKERRISQPWSFQRKEGNVSGRRASWCALGGWTDWGTLLSCPMLWSPHWAAGQGSLLCSHWLTLKADLEPRGVQASDLSSWFHTKKILGAVALECSPNRSPIWKITWERIESRVIA